MKRINVWVDEWLYDMLDDEAVQIAVFGQSHAYLKKHNKITRSRIIRKIVENYLRDRGFIE